VRTTIITAASFQSMSLRESAATLGGPSASPEEDRSPVAATKTMINRTEETFGLKLKRGAS
jgi:hypothetical protein